MNALAFKAIYHRRPGCRSSTLARGPMIRFALALIAAFGVVVSMPNCLNAQEGGSAVSQLIKEELKKIDQQAGADAANGPEYSAWKKDIQKVLQLWDQCQYQDAVRLSANLVPLGYGSEAPLIQRCNRFIIFLRCALMYEAGESASAELPLQGVLADEAPSRDPGQDVLARRLLAKVMIDCAKFEAGLAELDKALQIAIKGGTATDTELFAIMVDRVRTLAYIGRLVEARQIINEIGPKADELKEKAPAVYADYLATGGFLAHEEAEFPAAIELFADAAERHASISGPASRDSIEALINLGLAETETRRPDDAARHIREAMERIEKTFRGQHQFQARILQAFANLSVKTANYRESFDYAKEATKNSAVNEYDASAIVATMGDSLIVSDSAAARKCYATASKYYAKSGAKLKSKWADCDLARSHLHNGEYDQALKLYGTLLPNITRANLIAGDHRRLLQEMYYMACTLRRLDYCDDAERLLSVVIKRGAAKNAFTDTDMFAILVESGLCQTKLDDHQTAEASLERALELVRGQDAEASFRRAVTTAYLAECHIAMGQLERAKVEAAQANKLIRETHGEHSPHYAMYGLRPAAHIALKTREYETAEALLAKSIGIIEATVGNDAHELVSALVDYESALRGLDQVERADEVAARAEKIRLRFSQSEASNSLME